MSLSTGDIVKVRMAQGKLLKGVIKTISIYKPKVYGDIETTYGVLLDGTRDIVYYKEDDLIKEETHYIWAAECTCGATTVGSRMHSSYCDLTHNKKFEVN